MFLTVFGGVFQISVFRDSGFTKEIFLQNCVVILKRPLHNYYTMFPRYLVDSDVINISKYSITHWYLTRREGIKKFDLISNCAVLMAVS